MADGGKGLYTIYKAINKIDGKVYIGFDSNWPSRQKAHLYIDDNCYFHRAIKKYGKDSFEWEVLYQSKNREHTLSIMEPYYIREYNSFGSNGYNMTFGGEQVMLGKTHSLEAREKIKKARARQVHPRGMLGKHCSDEHKRKIREANLGRIVSNSTREKLSKAGIGHIVSEETRKKLSIAAKKQFSKEVNHG